MTGPARHAPLLVAVAGGALLFPLQARLDRDKAPPPDILEVLPPAPILPVLSFGHRQTAADLLEVRATTFLMRWLGEMNSLRHEHITRLYDAVLALDPQDPGAHLRAASYYYSVAGRPDLARVYLGRGVARVPRENRHRWRLFLELASIELLTDMDAPADVREQRAQAAGHILTGAVGLPGAPADLKDLAERLTVRGLPRLDALRYEEARWLERSQSGEPEMRAQAQRRLDEARAALVVEALQQVADDVAGRLGEPPRDLATLEGFASAALRQARRAAKEGAPLPDPVRVFDEHGLADPLGFGFKVERGRVAAPALEARRLERRLEERFLRWQQERPGATPTLADLELAAPPADLEVTVEAAGVSVRPR